MLTNLDATQSRLCMVVYYFNVHLLYNYQKNDILYRHATGKLLKIQFRKLSQNLSRANIASFANIQGTTVFFTTAELAIFAPVMLWESWPELNLERLSHSTNDVPQAKFSS